MVGGGGPTVKKDRYNGMTPLHRFRRSGRWQLISNAQITCCSPAAVHESVLHGRPSVDATPAVTNATRNVLKVHS
jgi:hypothetical protein